MVTDTARTGRLTHVLMAASTTPRTTRRYQEELQRMTHTPERRNEVLYAEVKACMNRGDTPAALALLDLLPDDYARVAQYRAQCRTFDTLCRTGVIERSGLSKMRRLLARLLEEEVEATSVCLLYTSPSPRDGLLSRMPSSA